MHQRYCITYGPGWIRYFPTKKPFSAARPLAVYPCGPVDCLLQYRAESVIIDMENKNAAVGGCRNHPPTCTGANTPAQWPRHIRTDSIPHFFPFHKGGRVHGRSEICHRGCAHIRGLASYALCRGNLVQRFCFPPVFWGRGRTAATASALPGGLAPPWRTVVGNG